MLLISNLARISIGLLLTIALISALIANPIGSSAAIAASAAVFLGVRKLSRWDGFVVDRIAKMLLIALIISNFAISVTFKSMQPSDFGVYFRCSWLYQLTIDANISICQSKYMDIGNLYWTRSFFYTIPLNAVFDHNYLALKLTNAILQSVFLGLLWGVVRASMGSVAALAALLFAGIYPERIFAIPLATTDHLALVLTVGAFGMTAAFSGKARGILFAVLISACVTIINAARGTGLFLLIGVEFALAAAGPARSGRRIAALLGILGLTTLFGSIFTHWFGGSPDTSQSGAGLMLLSGLDIATSQSFSSTFSWMAHSWPAIPAQDRLAVAMHRLLQEIAVNGHLLPKMIYEKTSTLFNGSGYANFATLDFSSNLDTELTAPAGSTAPLPGGAAIYQALAMPLLLNALIGVVAFRPTRLLLVAMVFFLAVCVTLIGFFTVQPRYSLVLLPSLAVFAGQAFSQFSEERRGSHGIALAALVFGGLVAFSVVAWLGIKSSTDLPLKDIRQSASKDDLLCDTAPVGLHGDALRQTITLPPGLACATFVVPLPRKTANVSLFIGSGSFPYLYQPREKPAFTFRIGNPEGFVKDRSIGDNSIAWLKTSVAPTGNVDAPMLTIRVMRAEGAEGQVNVLLEHLIPE